ncbi:50S ribosomal protein L3 [Candidatus Woesebacteria bacterium]|nr:50S ribosomal protein L3 [Candidatus Woesebacteria bacterium]
MLRDFFATKLGMTQAWTKAGKRLAVTRCKAEDMAVVSNRTVSVIDTNNQNRPLVSTQILEVGFGKKKLKNMSKPLRSRLTKSGFSVGTKNMAGIRLSMDTEAPAVGTNVAVQSVLQVGDIVQVQGQTKGRGFAGAMKRHGFHGGPATHGQSDRARAVGSIGNRTTPGRVWVGKRMPGHYGDVIQTVKNLVVIHIDEQSKEVWLSGPVPGAISGQVRIHKTGEGKSIDLDLKASGITTVVTTASAPEEEVAVSEVKE